MDGERQPRPGRHGTTLAAPEFTHFDDVHVVATPWTPDVRRICSSNTVTIAQPAPRLNIRVARGPEPGDDLLCSIISPATDPDGDTLTYTLS